MDTALKTAVMAALTQVEVKTVEDAMASDRLEYARLRTMRSDGSMRPLAARLSILVTLGWKRTTIAEAMDVSRVTLNKWLRDHTFGGETFKPYGPDALEGDPDSASKDEVLAPVVNKLTPRNAEELGQVRFEHDKFIVPAGFVRPLAALWRVAYRARGHELTTDPEIAAAGDALDILISVLLRRGVTNLAIANAAGVTHRAVLDRMNRARQRGLVLNCNGDDCEAFYGEKVIRNYFSGANPIKTALDEWLTDDAAQFVPVRITSPRPARYWLQTMTDTVTAEPVVMTLGEAHDMWHTRLSVAKHSCVEDSEALIARDEIQLTAALGRMNEASFESNSLAMRLRDRPLFVQAYLLYTEAMERTGRLPKTARQAKLHVPDALWVKYFAPFDVVQKCFDDPAEVESEFEPTVKHKADARTRRGVA